MVARRAPAISRCGRSAGTGSHQALDKPAAPPATSQPTPTATAQATATATAETATAATGSPAAGEAAAKMWGFYQQLAELNDKHGKDCKKLGEELKAFAEKDQTGEQMKKLAASGGGKAAVEQAMEKKYGEKYEEASHKILEATEIDCAKDAGVKAAAKLMDLDLPRVPGGARSPPPAAPVVAGELGSVGTAALVAVPSEPVAEPPIIFTISEDALSSVPKSLTSASLACGASPWQTAWRVVLPTGSPGIFSATMVGFGRAFGETEVRDVATRSAEGLVLWLDTADVKGGPAREGTYFAYGGDFGPPGTPSDDAHGDGRGIFVANAGTVPRD